MITNEAKDEPAERRPRLVTPFGLFRSDLHQQFRRQDISMDMTEFCQLAASEWRRLSSSVKQQYVDQLNVYQR